MWKNNKQKIGVLGLIFLLKQCQFCSNKPNPVSGQNEINKNENEIENKKFNIADAYLLSFESFVLL
jgi:hypothetical protein